jgi:hypothetical protein
LAIKASLIASSQPIFSRRSTYCEIVSDESGGDGPHVTIGYEPHFAKRARISRESPTEGWRCGRRWGLFGRCIAGHRVRATVGYRNINFATLPDDARIDTKNDIGGVTLCAANLTFAFFCGLKIFCAILL